MHSSTPLRVLRAQTSKQVASPRRFASHGAPHYNEPSGYLFAEKVKTSVAMHFRLLMIYLSRQLQDRSG